MPIILEGIITGLLLSIFVGATFFMLIETSMTRGFKAALWFDLGVVSCDSLLIILVYFFTSIITRLIVHNIYFNLAGGIAFVGFGINYIVARRHEEPHLKTNNRAAKLIFNGFFINLFNPAVIVFWLGTVTLAVTRFSMNGKETFLYFGTAIAVYAAIDVAKAYFASRLSSILNRKVLRMIYIVSGVIMIGLGAYILFTTW
jgi:threonine/homoserine/homoserine lactone efflux protein